MKKVKRLRISDLDLSILVFISDMKFVDVVAVGERFFKGKGERYPQKRLKDFVDVGLVALVTSCVYKTLSVKVKNYCKKLGVSCDTSNFFSNSKSSSLFL